MNKIEALEKLNQFIERHGLEGEELSYLLNKYEQMTDNDFLECKTPGDVYHIIQAWTKPKKKRQYVKPEKQTYYRLDEPIQEATEKAYGIVTGSNNLHGSRLQVYIEWIPISQIKEIENNIYIPAWLISKNSLWNFIDKDSKIEL